MRFKENQKYEVSPDGVGVMVIVHAYGIPELRQIVLSKGETYTVNGDYLVADTHSHWLEIDKDTKRYFRPYFSPDELTSKEIEHFQRLKEQYAGLALQGLLSSYADLLGSSRDPNALAETSVRYAAALVERIKKDYNER